jgi:hypothetical protein
MVMKWLSRILSTQAIEVRAGATRCRKGKMRHHVLEDVSELMSCHKVRDGEIWIDALGRMSFSREIPEHLHQRLRNILNG